MRTGHLDLYSDLDYRLSSSPGQQADNTAIVGNVIVRDGFDGMVLFVIMIGTLVDAAFTTVVLLEERDAADAFVAVADADMVPLTTPELSAAFIFSDDDTINFLGYIGAKDDVRLTITPSDNTGAMDTAVLAVLGGANFQPVRSPA